jgi:hypothetical protein
MADVSSALEPPAEVCDAIIFCMTTDYQAILSPILVTDKLQAAVVVCA